MADTVLSFVLQTLTSGHTNELNYEFDMTRVYPLGYRRDFAAAFQNGRIQLTTNYGDVSRDSPDPTIKASYSIDKPPGQTHYLYIRPDLTELRENDLYLRGKFSTQEAADLRGTIIHECTHALQDYQRLRIDPRTAEGSAYLAGAITRRRWGYQSHVADPNISGLAYALMMADRFLTTDYHLRYVIPPDQVRQLKSLVRTGSPSRYVFNGI